MLDWHDIQPLTPGEPLYIQGSNGNDGYSCLVFAFRDHNGHIWIWISGDPKYVARIMPWRVNLSNAPGEIF